MRTLLYIPVIHTQADMGSLADSVQRVTVEEVGRKKWENSVEAVNQFWQLLSQEVEKLDLPYPRVRLYQDGLPVCGREEAIVSELAEAESPNHQLLVHLMQRG
ncbi:MAG: hypothetical protein HQ583_06950, partial [Candidatus Abyssubacteria bacterium]|nr:hypothetical protein [Candidatus Abyssubacteria bacterium]